MKRLGNKLLPFGPVVALFGLMLSFTAAQAQSQDLKPAAEAGRISDTLRSQSYPEVIYGQVMPDFDRSN